LCPSHERIDVNVGAKAALPSPRSAQHARQLPPHLVDLGQHALIFGSRAGLS
jgi:hypothetical protein